MGAISENAASSDCSHDVRLSFGVSVASVSRGEAILKNSHFQKPPPNDITYHPVTSRAYVINHRISLYSKTKP